MKEIGEVLKEIIDDLNGQIPLHNGENYGYNNGYARGMMDAIERVERKLVEVLKDD